MGRHLTSRPEMPGVSERRKRAAWVGRARPPTGYTRISGVVPRERLMTPRGVPITQPGPRAPSWNTHAAQLGAVCPEEPAGTLGSGQRGTGGLLGGHRGRAGRSVLGRARAHCPLQARSVMEPGSQESSAVLKTPQMPCRELQQPPGCGTQGFPSREPPPCLHPRVEPEDSQGCLAPFYVRGKPGVTTHVRKAGK